MGAMDLESHLKGKYTTHLFRNVKNTAELRQKIFGDALPVVLLQPKLIVDEFQVQMAAFKAESNLHQQRMSTKTLQTEIIYCLSPFKHITESLKLFSATDTDTDLLVVAEPNHFESFNALIQGTEVSLDELSNVTDTKAIMDLYQVTAEELTNSTLVDSIVSRMAAKEYYSITSGN